MSTDSRLLWVGVVAVLLVHGILLWIHSQPQPYPLFGDEEWYWAEAKTLSAGDGHSWDALWSPLYPAFLSGLLSLGGDDLRVVWAAQTLLLIGVALFSAAVARELGLSSSASLWILFFALAFPPLVAFAHYLWPEMLHLLLFLQAFWLLAREERPTAWMLVAGVLLGLACLTRIQLALFSPVLLWPLLKERRERWKALLVIGGALLVLAPAALRSHQASGRWVPGSSAAFNIWVGLTDVSRQNHVRPVVGRAYGEYRRSGSTPGARDRVVTEKIATLVRDRGVGAIMVDQVSRQYFRLFHWGSFFTDRLPGGSLSGAERGFPDTPLWLARGLRWTSWGLYLLLICGAALGVALTSYRGRPWLSVALLFLVYHLAIFFVLHVKTRYRVPMLPFLLFFAGLAWDAVRERRELPPWRWLGGAGLALILVFLATAGPYLDRLGAR